MGTLLSPTPLKRLQATNQLGLVARGRVAWQLLDAHADRPLYLRNVSRGRTMLAGRWEVTGVAMMAAAVRTNRETSKSRRRVSMSGLMGSAYFDGTHNSPPSDTALS